MNFDTSSYAPTTSYGGNPPAFSGTTSTASNDPLILPNTNRSYVEELTSFDVRNYLPCPKHKLDIKLNFTYNDALDPYLVKDPLSMIKYESQYNSKTYQPSSVINSNYSYLKSDDFYSNGEPKPYYPRTFTYNFEQEKQKDESNKNKAKKGEPKVSERKQNEARANDAKGSDGKGKKKQCKVGEVDPDHNNNFLRDIRGKFGANPDRWQDCQVTNRIDELAQPKRLPCEYQDNRKSVYWITKRPPPKPECCNHTHFETSERLDELATPKVVCGEFCGARHCCWECEYPKPPVSDIDPRTVDWSRLASPKRKYPPNGVPIQPVKRSALKFNPTKRLCKLSEPKKVINSDKYYLWLWKKKPDNTIILKKVRRRSIDKCDLTNMRVMIRCDLSLDPVSEACRKLKAVLPTIKYALDKGAQSVVIISSCVGSACVENPDNSLDRLTDALQQHLGRSVIYLEDCVGYQARALCADPEPGSIFLLENIGFHPEELGRRQLPDGTMVDCKPEEIEKFRSTLFGLADIYVVDSIAELVDMTNTTIGIKNQEKAYGFIIKNELDYFNRFAVRPQQPMAAVIGGKFKEKIKVVRNVMGIAQEIILGGELAMIFLKALRKIDIGSTQWTPKMLKKALKIHTRAKDTNTAIYLPSDVVVRNITSGEYFTVLTRDDIDEGYEVVDIGPFTRGCYEKVISFARTILWCGEMGELADGTTSISNAFAAATNRGAWTYIADDATKKIFYAIQEPENVSHVTANGELTSMLLNGKLPKGLAVLNRYRKKIKKRQPIPVIPSNKPVTFDIPGAMIDNGSRIMGIHDVPLEGRRVLIRVDFSVPNTKVNNLSNNYRMRMTIPTIKYALRNRAKSVVIIAHQGTPSGRKVAEFSLKPICDALASLLGQAVLFVPETVGKSVEAAINQIHPGAVLMVENLRFNLEEEGVGISKAVLLKSSEHVKATPEAIAQFCESMTNLGDVYVNDAFSCLDLDHSSVTGYYKTPRVAGFLVKNELKYMAKVFNNPKRKFLVIVGGKISKDKVFTMLDMMKEVDDIIVAGEIASIFLKFDLGMMSNSSKYDNSLEDMVKAIITLAPYYKCNLHYPVDLWIAEPGGENPSLHSITKPIPEGKEIVDVGDLSATMFARIVKKSNIILWTGTLGVTKIEAFAKGTKVLLDAIKEIANDPEKEVISIVCGRSCSEFINAYNPTYEGITHLSTAGTAVMKLLTSRRLYALDALSCKPTKKLPNFMAADSGGEFADQRVLVKADLNLPLDRMKDPFPLRQLIPLIKFLQRKGARVITLIGHVGNPSGRRESYFSLAPVKAALEEILDQPVTFVSDGVADNTDVIIRSQEPGRVVLLENIRFHPEEEGIGDGPPGSKLTINISHEALNDFRNKLSSLGDVFINESFGTLYETNTSVVGMKHKQKLAGPTLKKEVTRYMELKTNMELPLLAIYGGEPTVEYMLRIYDSLDVVNEVIMCGDLALAFYKVDESIKLGKSPVNVNTLKYVPKIVKKARANGIPLHLPVDFVIAEQLTREPAPIIPGQEEPLEPADLLPETEVVIVSQGIPKTHQVFDIGPSSIMNFAQVIAHAKTIIYVGYAGYYEHEPFVAGTKALLSAIQAATNSGIPTVALGMETGVCIGQMNAADVFSTYSTSLATFLHILLHKPLPGLSVLSPATEKKLKKLRIDQIELRGKRVLIRLDLFVPTVDGVVLDSDKLEDAVPTIRFALKMGAKCVVLLGHRGEPNGYRNQYLTLAPLIEEFNQILGLKVSFIDRPCSTKAKTILAEPTPGSVFLMENLKFYPAEYGRDAEPGAQLHSQEPISEGIVTDRAVSGLRMKPDSKASDDDLTTGEETIHSISDGDGGRSIDAIMFQFMSIKSVQQYKEEIAACGDVFINDDVTDVEETLTSLEGFGLAERAVGLQMIQYLQDSDDSVYDLPGLANLSPAPVG